jgi:hypothetical protein
VPATLFHQYSESEGPQIHQTVSGRAKVSALRLKRKLREAGAPGGNVSAHELIEQSESLIDFFRAARSVKLEECAVEGIIDYRCVAPVCISNIHRAPNVSPIWDIKAIVQDLPGFIRPNQGKGVAALQTSGQQTDPSQILQ